MMEVRILLAAPTPYPTSSFVYHALRQAASPVAFQALFISLSHCLKVCHQLPPLSPPPPPSPPVPTPLPPPPPPPPPGVISAASPWLSTSKRRGCPPPVVINAVLSKLGNGPPG